MPFSRVSSGPRPGVSVVVTSTDPVGGSCGVVGHRTAPDAAAGAGAAAHLAVVLRADGLAQVRDAGTGRAAGRRSRGGASATSDGTTTARWVTTASTCSRVMWRIMLRLGEVAGRR